MVFFFFWQVPESPAAWSQPHVHGQCPLLGARLPWAKQGRCWLHRALQARQGSESVTHLPSETNGSVKKEAVTQ